MIRAVVFDVDGTLVDSVDLHARAWQEAFAHFGRQIPYEEVRHQIGKGGDQLLPVFFSRLPIPADSPARGKDNNRSAWQQTAGRDDQAPVRSAWSHWLLYS